MAGEIVSLSKRFAGLTDRIVLPPLATECPLVARASFRSKSRVSATGKPLGAMPGLDIVLALWPRVNEQADRGGSDGQTELGRVHGLRVAAADSRPAAHHGGVTGNRRRNSGPIGHRRSQTTKTRRHE